VFQVEYLVVAFDDNNHKVRLSLCQAEVLKALAKDEELSKNGGCVPDLHPK
jgi:glutamate--cysteine ligase catalytic subunit